MSSPYIESFRKKMDYDEGISPIENLQFFFNAVKVLRYEWIKEDIDGKIKYYLDSPWKNEVGLKDINMEFQRAFTKHLVKLSMDESQEQDYMLFLRDCKEALRGINHYYTPSFHEVLIITRPEIPDEVELSVDPATLPEDRKISIQRCYELFMVLFKQLEECVNDEMKDYERKEYVRDKSTFQWVGDKNDLSELAMAIFASGRIKRTGKKKMMAATFARELAAFLGVERLNFEQDIDLIGTRQRRKPGEFIEKCREALLQFFQKKYDKN